MFKNSLSKKTKAIVAIAAVTSLLMTNIGPLATSATTNDSIQQTASTQKYRNVMYYGDWSIWGGQKNFYPQDIPADQLTHLNFAFLDFDANGNLIFADKDADSGHPLNQPGVTYGDVNGGILNGFQVLRDKNPNLKIGVSLGGWSMSGDFAVVAANPTLRAKLIKNTLDFIRYTNMDFVDLDWEYPSDVRDPDLCDNARDEGTKYSKPEDKQNYVTLLKEFREALDKQGQDLGKKYELSVALPAPIAKVDKGIDVPGIFKYVDFANIMTYDMRGAWDDISGHHAGLYTNPNDPLKGKGLSVDESVKYFMSKGAPAEKIVIGAAYYSRGWEKISNENTNSSTPGLFGKATQVNKDADFTPSYGAKPEAPLKNGEGGRNTGTWSYGSFDELKKAYPGLKEYWDDSAKAPYMYNESTGAFFTYDNVRSIQEKAKYIKENQLGGMIAWMASNDKPTTPGSQVRDELTKATKVALYGDEPLVKHDIPRERMNVTAKVSYGPAQYGGGSIINIAVTNNEKMTTAGEVLTTVERAAKSLKNTKVYIEMTDGIKITGAQYPTPVVKEENGYYVCDLGGLADGKIWAPGTTRTYTLTTDKPLSSVNDIVSVFYTQRMYLDSAEFGKQSLFGYSADEEIKDVNGNYLPTISGVRNKTLTVKDPFDPLAGITANDKEDGNLTSKIVVTGTVNTRKAGKYPLTYTVTDSKGGKREASCVITVKNKTIIEPDNYDPKKAYNTGDIIVYKGIRYQYMYFGVSPVEPGTHEGIWKTLGPAEVEVIEPDIIDLATVAAKYNTTKGSPSWDEECDVNKDGIVDLFDLVSVSKTL